MCAFVRALGPRGSVVYDRLSVIPIHVVGEMVVHVQSYIDLEIAKEGRNLPKEVNKENYEGKWL